MNKKLLTRFLCALLTVLTMVSVVPAFTISVHAADELIETVDYTTVKYASAEERLAAMVKYYEDENYALYVDQVKGSATVSTLGTVAYVKKATGEILFTNPWDMSLETTTDANSRADMMSQIILTYSGNGATKTLDSYTDAVLKGQVTVKAIKGGVRVEYAIGERSARILVPQVIERSALEEKILTPLAISLGKKQLGDGKTDEDYLKAGKTVREYIKFEAYFNPMFYTDPTINATKKESISLQYPVTKEKNIDIYVCDVNASTKQLREMEALILAYCPDYTFEVMDNDHDFVNYQEEAISPPVFKMALEYTLDASGLIVSLSGNGLRYDENVYRIKDLQILPYMGASYKQNDGYSFIPDGSGALYDLDVNTTTSSRVYGDDFALEEELYSYHNETVRVPVFGQVETKTEKIVITPAVIDPETGKVITPAVTEDGAKTSRGFLAIIEQGETLASIAPNHVAYLQYASVIPSFITRQNDVSQSKWSVYASRRYVEDYRIRYVMLSDDGLAQKAGLTSYYECSWMGMAAAYRDYLAATNEGYKRLTAEDVKTSIPLYIETFGCVDTVEKVLSMPVTVSVPLTSFEDIATMYDYLAGNGVTNVNFKLKGYANGGLYADVPYKLKWESAVGGASGFKDLLEKAAADGFGLYPDFDFVYTSQGNGGDKVNLKKHASRTIDNRYTTKRVYSATHQTLISYYQMVLSPVTYSRFYEKLEKRYAKYDYANISLASFGNSVNSDYDEEKTALREEAKEYVIEALSYFSSKNYDIMLEGGNVFTWNYADHILNVPTDSSRYNAELSAVPFVGVVLHGYREYAGSALNMEGNLSYAMLKAMENGAAAYFILSYANTELLKEDEVLSQNYSVRYDIWQQRLVEIYLELNNVLSDVQTKLIVNHEILNHNESTNTSRVPDEDELLKDIADAAEEAKNAIAEKIEADRLAKLEELSTARDLISAAPNSINVARVGMLSALKTDTRSSMMAQLISGTSNMLLKIWKRTNGGTTIDELKATEISTLQSMFNSYIISNYASIRKALLQSERDVVNAKVSYDKLIANNVNVQILTQAKADLEAAIDNYVELLNAYYNASYALETSARDAYVAGTESALSALAITATGTELVVEDADLEAFIFGVDDGNGTLVKDDTIAAKYADIGADALFNAYVAALAADGYYNPTDPTTSKINVKALLDAAMNTRVEEEEEQPGETPDTDGPGSGLEEEDIVVPDAPKSKYSVDNNVVAVTYGESKATPYKTLLLNFNDYTVQTTYNGVTYTITAYEYVVIMH